MHPSFLSPLSLTIYSLYLQLLQLWTKNRLLPSLSESSVQLIPCIPKHAALVRGLSDSSATRSRPRRPPLQSYAPRRSVRDCFRPLSTTRPSRAPCSTVSVSEHAALTRGPSHSTATRRRSRRPRIQHLALRRGLQDHLCCFTPPQILHTLDVFPSNQGKFRVSLPKPQNAAEKMMRLSVRAMAPPQLAQGIVQVASTDGGRE